MPSNHYVPLPKIARKHKPALVTAAAIALCLLLGTTVSAWQAIRATAAEAEAETNAQKADEKAQEATKERDEAQKQRDEVKSLNDKLLATQSELRSTLYGARIHLVQQAWDLSGVDCARELLALAGPTKAGEPDLRGFEWHYLNRVCNRELRTLKPPTAPIERLAYSPDGKRIAIGNSNKIIKLVDAETGRELLEFAGHSAAIHTLAFSPDGKVLVSASGQSDREGKLTGETKIWNAETAGTIFTVDGGTRCMALSPDGKLVAGASGDYARNRGESSTPLSLKVWDAQTGQELHDLKEQHAVTSMVFSPDGKRLAYAIRPGWGPGASTPPSLLTPKLKIWDVTKGEELVSWDTQQPAVSLSFARLGPSRMLAGVLQGGTVVIWDSLRGTQVSSKEVTGGHTAVFSPDGKFLAITGRDNVARLWAFAINMDVEARRVDVDLTNPGQFEFKGHASTVSSIAFSPDSKHLATGSWDKTVKIWDIVASRKLVLRGNNGYLNRVTFSPNGKLLAGAADPGFMLPSSRGRPASASEGSTVRIWDRQTGQMLLALKDQAKGAKAVAFSSDGKTLASVARGETLTL